MKSGTIQKKINYNSAKEIKEFLEGKTTLIGTNLQQNSNDTMLQNLELYPFTKQRNIKTLVVPLTRNRISESLEKERLLSEKNI